MANLRGRIHALEKKIAKQDEVILELGDELGDTADNLANAQNMVRALKNPDMLIDGDSLTLDRIQVMETGDIRIIKPTPAPITETCVKAPEPEKNGKKPEKEPVNAS
jgi:uncharacterized coiled-coil protein SlyX